MTGVQTCALPISGTPELLQLRQENFTQHKSDVYAVRWTGGGGFGDPLNRAPEDIERDLENYAITPAAAHSLYGAVLTADETVDVTATAEHRAAVRAARVSKHQQPCRTRGGQVLIEASAGLQVKQDADGIYWACRTCSTDLGTTQHNFKDGCIREDSPVSASNPLIGNPIDFIDDAVAFRQFYCPGCGAQIDNEIAVSSDPILRDISVAL